MVSGLQDFNQAEVNRLAEEEYLEYERSAASKGYIYYYGGQEEGPETANMRFFGTKKARVMFDRSDGKWCLSPVMLWPKWDLKPLIMNEAGFREVMGQYGVPKSVLDNLVNENFPPNFFEI